MHGDHHEPLDPLRPSPRTLILGCTQIGSQTQAIVPSRLLSKEVIRPQVPLRPPCYDFFPLAETRFGTAKGAMPRQIPTRVKRRAVCARSRDVFTAR
jgi:hypothetical protein